ncbi:hypothetical protein DXG03_009549 [Asterophora parasitica]|uniref:Uncharacterized protein n=1 Tax=Asterophora parasitica TaxID=117018 RepID=A0A9P7G6U1_9AGAR|nr:hypothetical protein DXG03_009549 [Asterophora parasitica]
MWEAHTGHTDQAPRVPQTQTEWEWDSIRPFSASYVPKTKSTPTAPGGGPAAPAVIVSDNIIRKIFRFLAPGPASIIQYPPTVRLAPEAAETEPPSRVKVAVLIAMPHPPDEKAKSNTPPSGDPLGPSSSTAIAPTIGRELLPKTSIVADTCASRNDL